MSVCGTAAQSWCVSVYSLMSEWRCICRSTSDRKVQRARGDLQPEHVVQRVGQHADQLGDCDRRPFVEAQQLGAVGSAELGRDEAELAVAQAVDAAERQLAFGLVRQAERRVGEVQGAGGGVAEVVGAVQPAAVVAVGQGDGVARRVDPEDPAVAVLADRQLAEGETLGSRAGFVAGRPVRLVPRPGRPR
jgi:hypothetical protein